MANYDHEKYWTEIKTLAESNHLDDIQSLALKIADDKERIAFLRFVVRALMFREWNQKNLDPLIPLADSAIATALKIGEIDEANIICYNMSSNLAGCWDNGFKHERRHFEKGLTYAERAVNYRHELNKGPEPFALAYWACGIHNFYLGDFVNAEKNFQLSLNSAAEGAKANHQPTDLVKEAPFNILIAMGYIEIARIAQSQTYSTDTFEKVLATFEEMKMISDDAKEDAEIGLNQLRFVYKNLN